MLLEQSLEDNSENFKLFLISAFFSEKFRNFIYSKYSFLIEIFKCKELFVMVSIFEDIYNCKDYEEEIFVHLLDNYFADSQGDIDLMLSYLNDINELEFNRVKAFKKIVAEKISRLYIGVVTKQLQNKVISIDEYYKKINNSSIGLHSDKFSDPKYARHIDIGGVNPDVLIEQVMDSVIKTPYKEINDLYPEGGILRGQVGVILTPPNVGKTMMTLNLHRGFVSPKINKDPLNVLAFQIGEMTEYSILTRLTSQITNSHYRKVRTREHFKELLQRAKNMSPEMFDKFRMYYYYLTPGEFTSKDIYDRLHDWILDVPNLGKIRAIDWFDIVTIDYDSQLNTDNTIQTTKNNQLYIASSEAYYDAIKIAKHKSERTGKELLVLFTSQTQRGLSDSLYISLEHISESSKKERVIDFMFTMASPYAWRTPTSCGIFRSVKGRNSDYTEIYYVKDYSGKFIFLNKEVVENIVNSNKDLKIKYTAIDELVDGKNYFSLKREKKKIEENNRVKENMKNWGDSQD